MQVAAKLKYARISPQKCRLVADMVRGQSVGQALSTLRFTPKKGAKLVRKVLESAIANAENNHNADIDVLKVDGPRMLRAGNARRAAELCRAWVDLDLANSEAWHCLGRAQQALGLHQDALNSFRKAKLHDPMNRSLDAAIDSAQRGIVADFLNRYRR